MTSAPSALEVTKLNLGSRGTRIPGFANVDIQPGPEVDFVTDAADLSWFLPGKIEEIYASNILEHFPHTRTLAVLKEWARVLAPGGRLWVSVPDFDACMKIYQRTKVLNDWLRNYMYGDQNGPQEFHYATFTWPNLRELLDQAGFARARRLEDLPFGLSDHSAIVDSHEHTPMALNCEAIR